MSINLKIIYFYFYKDGFWFRLWNDYGLAFKSKRHPVYFSERNGYVKPFKLFGWRILKLKPND